MRYEADLRNSHDCRDNFTRHIVSALGASHRRASSGLPPHPWAWCNRNIFGICHWSIQRKISLGSHRRRLWPLCIANLEKKLRFITWLTLSKYSSSPLACLVLEENSAVLLRPYSLFSAWAVTSLPGLSALVLLPTTPRVIWSGEWSH
jgi:hypothetical protein